MIVPQGPHLGQMLRYVGRPLLALLAWDVAIVLAFKLLHWEWVGSRHIPLALYGGAISVVVGFRNNSAYARWWEARTLWGQIVNNSRNLAREVISTLRSGPAEDPGPMHTLRRRLVYHQIAYVHALRQHLRRLPPMDPLAPFLTPSELAHLARETNVPVALQLEIARMVQQAEAAGWISPQQWQAIDGSLSALANAQGGAERIKNTPMPKQYDFFPMLFVQIYCLLLPVGLVENLGLVHAPRLFRRRLHVPGARPDRSRSRKSLQQHHLRPSAHVHYHGHRDQPPPDAGRNRAPTAHQPRPRRPLVAIALS